MTTTRHHCDGCGKMRRDVVAVGRDANGDPDAPDLCLWCRTVVARRWARLHKGKEKR